MADPRITLTFHVDNEFPSRIDARWANQNGEPTVRSVLIAHRVVGAGGLGVEDVVCACATSIWMSVDEHIEHVAAALEEAGR